MPVEDKPFGTRLTVFFASILSVSAASGQEASVGTEAREETERLEEIVVTARYRTEAAQDMGMSISAISGEDLERQGINDFADIALRTPGLNLSNRGPNKYDISFRGLSNTTLAYNWQRSNPLVGIFLDGVSVVTPFATQRSFNLYDIERVEIVRGPQGTLYGEGAMGGAIRYISADPELDEFGSKFKVTASTTESASGLNWRADGTMNIPVVNDRFGLRVTGYRQEDQGFIDFTGTNTVAGSVLDGVPTEDANDYEAHGLRVVALAEPMEHLRARVAMHYENSKSDTEWVVTGDADDLTNANDFALSPQEDEIMVLSGQLEYRTYLGMLSSVTGFVDRKRKDLGLEPGATYLLRIPATKNFDIDEQMFSQELRFVSDLGGPLNFLAGVYYKNTDTFVDLIELSANPALPGTVLNENEAYRAEQVAVFGEVIYRATDKLTGTLGLRYFKEDVDAMQEWIDPDVGLSGLSPNNVLETTLTIEEALPKFLLEYQSTDDVLMYAGASRGARNGGLNITSTRIIAEAFGAPAPATYEEDSVWSYEVGVKSQWNDRRVTANLSLFYVDWSNLPTIVITPPFGLQGYRNAGSASSKGAGLELAVEANEFLSLFFAGNVTDAQLEEDVVLNALNGATAASGTAIPFTPDFTISTGMDLVYPMENVFGGDVTVAGHVDFQYTGEQAGQIATTPEANPEIPFYEVEGYSIVNLRLGLQGQRWGLALFVDNLLNQNENLYKLNGSTLTTGNIWSVNRPRTVGFALNGNF